MDKVSLRNAVTLALCELGIQVLEDPTRFLSMLHDCCAENDIACQKGQLFLNQTIPRHIPLRANFGKGWTENCLQMNQ